MQRALPYGSLLGATLIFGIGMAVTTERFFPGAVSNVWRQIDYRISLTTDGVSKAIRFTPTVLGDNLLNPLVRAFEFDAKNFDRLTNIISFVAYQHSVDPDLLRAMAIVGSGFDPQFRDNEGRRGLLALPVRVLRAGAITSPFDVQENLNVGAATLATLLKENDNNTELALASLCAGKEALKEDPSIQYQGTCGDFTQNVMRAYQLLQHR